MKTMAFVFVIAAAAVAILFYKRAPAQNSNDDLVIQQLRAAGSNLSKPHPIQFYLYVPSEEAAQRVSATLSRQGFQVQVRTAALGSGWLALASKTLVPTRKALVDIRQLLSKLAEGEGGEYDGWEAQVVK